MARIVNIGLMLSDVDLSINGLCYADIAEIRDVISSHRHKLWLEMIKGQNRRRTDKRYEELEALRVKLFSGLNNELSPIGRCNRILHAIQVFEDELKAKLEG